MQQFYIVLRRFVIVIPTEGAWICTLPMCTKKKVSKKGFVYTARQNGSFSRVIPEQCTEKRPYRVVCLYTVAVCKLGRNELTGASWPKRIDRHPATNKNAPQDCEAFGAENEMRTISCNILIINNLQETKKDIR